MNCKHCKENSNIFDFSQECCVIRYAAIKDCMTMFAYLDESQCSYDEFKDKVEAEKVRLTPAPKG